MDFQSSFEKKGKDWIVLGWFQPKRPSPEGKARALAPAKEILRRGPQGLANQNWLLSLLPYVADRLQKSPPVSISLHRLALDGAKHGELNSDELNRSEGAKTGAQLRTKPNPRPREYFP
jgi:hypothetical protein